MRWFFCYLGRILSGIKCDLCCPGLNDFLMREEEEEEEEKATLSKLGFALRI